MAKRSPNGEGYKPDEIHPIKMPKDFLRLVRTVAAWKDVSMTQYIVDSLTPIIRRDLTKAAGEMRGEEAA